MPFAQAPLHGRELLFQAIGNGPVRRTLRVDMVGDNLSSRAASRIAARFDVRQGSKRREKSSSGRIICR